MRGDVKNLFQSLGIESFPYKEFHSGRDEPWLPLCIEIAPLVLNRSKPSSALGSDPLSMRSHPQAEPPLTAAPLDQQDDSSDGSLKSFLASLQRRRP